MEKRKVLKVTSKQKVPPDRQLLGTKWVFKVNKNGVLKARLVAQEYTQIPGIDHTSQTNSIWQFIFYLAFITFYFVFVI